MYTLIEIHTYKFVYKHIIMFHFRLFNVVKYKLMFKLGSFVK